VLATPQTRRTGLIASRLCGVSVFVFCLIAPRSLSQVPRPQSAAPEAKPRTIEVTADHDSQYRIRGQSKPVITVTAGEQVVLRITAIKAKSKNRDGSIHGFSLLRARDRQPIPGWDFLLRPGLNEFTATAPSEPGDYEVVCTVVCSEDHEQMSMKFVVVVQGK